MAPLLAVVVESRPIGHTKVAAALTALGYRYTFVTTNGAELEVFQRHPDLVIVAAAAADSWLAADCLHRLHSRFSEPRYVFLASSSTEDLAIAAFHSGANRYLKEPWSVPMLQSVITALLPVSSAEPRASDDLSGGDRLVGGSDAIRRLRAHVSRIAPAGSNVLVLGETGTGKELVAELVHLNGGRSTKPFVCINTAAIPDSLLESELFGHERGAFTGANAAQGGKLAAAHGGTAFLDEIGDVSPAIQAKLLRAIESKSVYRLGGTRAIQLDVRIIAATNSDLESAVAESRFRKDLYYRLNVVRIEVPPLRDRADDIPLLINHYLLRFNREFGRSVRGLSPRAMDTLRRYHWPGNVRELRNVIEALIVNLSPETSGVVDVPPEVMRQLATAVSAPVTERERLLSALAATNWNKSRAASQLRCSRMTLYRKLQQYRLSATRNPGSS